MKQETRNSFAFIPKLFAALALTTTLTAMTFLTGCGEFFRPVNNSPGGNGTSSFVYVTNVGSAGTGGTLSAYSLTSGKLAVLTGSPISLPATPTSIVVAPNNAFLYVGTDSGVFLYTIASDGTLTEGNSDTVIYLNATSPIVQSLAVDSTNSWLLIANQKSTELDALAIDPTTGIPPSVTPYAATLSNPSAVQMTISAANTNVAVAVGAGGSNVFGFTASSTKSPWGTEVTIPLQTSTTAANDSTSANAIAFDTTSTYLFVGETLQSSATDLLRLIPVAALNADKADYPVGHGPSAILADASGAYVYVANNTDNSITGFSLSAGALTALNDSPFATAKAPVVLLEDSSKTYLLDIGFGTNPNLYVYSFDSTTPGTLDVSATTTTGVTDPSLANAMALSH